MNYAGISDKKKAKSESGVLKQNQKQNPNKITTVAVTDDSKELEADDPDLISRAPEIAAGEADDLQSNRRMPNDHHIPVTNATFALPRENTQADKKDQISPASTILLSISRQHIARSGGAKLEQQPEVLSEEKETQSERAQKFEQNEQAREHEQLERSQKPKQVENKDRHQNIDKDAKVGKTEMKKAESNKGFVLIIERTQRQRGDDMHSTESTPPQSCTTQVTDNPPTDWSQTSSEPCSVTGIAAATQMSQDELQKASAESVENKYLTHMTSIGRNMDNVGLSGQNTPMTSASRSAKSPRTNANKTRPPKGEQRWEKRGKSLRSNEKCPQKSTWMPESQDGNVLAGIKESHSLIQLQTTQSEPLPEEVDKKQHSCTAKEVEKMQRCVAPQKAEKTLLNAFSMRHFGNTEWVPVDFGANDGATLPPLDDMNELVEY
ncbi:hypothetical protein Tcan_04415 [Toxocara canis]|uniref:Uncharacterized protein n=1 Tax=Toxocara canis TaxID=6265 RepID=A0A0B2VQZ2_TOXCA|nr:hypothetical protein Tcan_04415 [Toxocara canis]